MAVKGCWWLEAGQRGVLEECERYVRVKGKAAK
jgi:hypothetical protein